MSTFNRWEAAKAVWGTLVAALMLGLPALYLALDDSAVTLQEWVAVVIAALGVPATGRAIYVADNRKKPPAGRTSGHRRGETGISDVGLGFLVVGLALIAVGLGWERWIIVVCGIVAAALAIPALIARRI